MNFEKWKNEIIRKINDKKEVSIIYHSDPDGICSSTILFLFLNSLGKNVKLISTKYGLVKIDEEIVKKSFNSELIFILDLSSIPKDFKEIKERVVIIDHHLVKQELKNFFLINPRLINENFYYPTSYLVWKMFFDKVKNTEWIAYFGCKADKCEKCNDLYLQALKKFPELKRTKEIFEYLNLSRNLKSSLIINLALIETYKFGSPKYFKLTHAYHTLKSLKKQIEREIASWLLNKQKIFENDKIQVFRICSEFNIQGAIASRILKNSKKQIICIFNDCLEQSKVYFEFRSKTDAYNLFEKLMKELCIDYGGHERAFGCTVNEAFLEKFIERIKNL